ncbi:imidazolonepropionase [Gemmata obscuriglobus]|uniref:Amidohydrolase n=1 Tax=Gemmata obscuriglobus TaxID=114 RepID=A0A2Z3HAE2_9BACT|nr:amidohydrolase family protein [Gemmata obscuriglobus]AWM39965.1 amidohydrolase [Gemmata obscuriglobus]QEG26891.1 imidazolonepropionase [Gemmata obscuriglobus]VTS02964.1 amidohydrolase : Amidohydrolase, imidazolonepropionase OS=Singulisphaera acidiphila (strain ATCC BAA-1392 / DSM 18658 / VKM B-2454 / MOB10) GN=Sinac_7119 PE=4 SV=1: Amidohydro_5: Amidohydro_4: Amidohydro_4 [Gemmata obscuriglobus UQM 2246]
MRRLAALVPIVIALSLPLVPGAGAPAAARAADADRVTAFTGATIHTAATDRPIENGTLVVKGGRIAAVGAAADVTVPPGAEVVDLKGRVVIPGLVDTHSHVGVYSRPGVAANSDGNEMSGPVQPGVRAIDSFNADDPGIKMALAGGVTTANVMPGSGNVIGGQTVYVKYRGRSVEEMRVTGRAWGKEILGGLKMANGENPKGYGRGKGVAPFTRMKVAAMQRETFQKAKEYRAKLEGGGKVDRDVALEPLVEVLDGKRTVHFHCHRADDLLTAVRLSEEFGFELVLQHATEGYRVADVLAKKKIPVSLTLIDSPGGKAETMGLLEENAAILNSAGVIVTINTDDSVTESRFLLRTGAIAARGGMSEADALKAITIRAAKLLHLDHRLGSLEKGKDADFAVLSGSPFSVYTRVEQTWIDGQKVFDVIPDRGYQTGGFALPAGEKLPTPPPGPRPAPEARDLGTPTFDGNTPELKGAVAVTAEFIHTGGRVFPGVIVAKDGKILHVVAGEATAKNMPIYKAKHVTPGLIDPFCSAGLSGAWNSPADQDQDETSDPNQADLRALDGFNPREPLLDFLVANGTTVVHATPGRVNPIAGRGGVFRADGTTADSALVPVGALVVNLGESSKGKSPTTRMGVAALVRKAFTDADAYRTSKPAAKNPKHEALVPALEGKANVYFAAHRRDDIQTALRIAAEFKLKPVIALGTEGYRMAEELKQAGVPVVVHPTMLRAGGSIETMHAFTGNVAALDAAGVPVTVCTGFEGYVPKTRVLRYEAAMAAAAGMDRERALSAITINAAKLLGIDKEYGSIEVSKVADLVLYDGDPFEHTTHVTHTLLRGKVAYDRAEYLKLPFERRVLPLLTGGSGTGCCLGW